MHDQQCCNISHSDTDMKQRPCSPVQVCVFNTLRKLQIPKQQLYPSSATVLHTAAYLLGTVEGLRKSHSLL